MTDRTTALLVDRLTKVYADGTHALDALPLLGLMSDGSSDAAPSKDIEDDDTRWTEQMSEQTADTSQELMVDFITSLDGYGSAEGWPGWWGLEGPEYLGWLEGQPESGFILLMGSKTYELMSGWAQSAPADENLSDEETESLTGLAAAEKVVISSTLKPPYAWPNTTVLSGDVVDLVSELKRNATKPIHTLGSVSLCRSLMAAGLVDRFRVVIFPVITGRTGGNRIYDGYEDFALELVESRTFDDRSQLLEYVPRLLDAPLRR